MKPILACPSDYQMPVIPSEVAVRLRLGDVVQLVSSRQPDEGAAASLYVEIVAIPYSVGVDEDGYPLGEFEGELVSPLEVNGQVVQLGTRVKFGARYVLSVKGTEG